MASYRGHLAFASVLGAAYGAVGSWWFHLDWGPVFLGAGLTALGGLLPDLDSDSGVPVRELFNLAATIVPLFLIHRLRAYQFSPEETIVLLGAVYIAIRYGLSELFKRHTVHRGMFHSIPALFIAGLATFLVFHTPDDVVRWFVAGGVMLGFLSHLALDEAYSIDFNGARIRLNKYAGSTVKFWSPSATATFLTYLILFGLLAGVWVHYAGPLPGRGAAARVPAPTRTTGHPAGSK
jgi:LexA-binding, inner membrane-associated putative hydrolase